MRQQSVLADATGAHDGDEGAGPIGSSRHPHMIGVQHVGVGRRLRVAGEHGDQRIPLHARARREVVLQVIGVRLDRAGVLLVNAVYKETWDLLGGAVEAEESPHAACRREVAEELGLDRAPGRVLAVDWVPSRPNVRRG